jgi:esterase/lipase
LLLSSIAAAQDSQPPLRGMKYTSRAPAEADQWQRELRARIFALLQMRDLIDAHGSIPLEPKLVKSEEREQYTWQEWEIRSTPSPAGRSISIAATIPHGLKPPYPAIVCIHGHGGTRRIVYDAQSIYKGFADELARRGYVTIACDVGQHEIREPNRSLMGERLWDLIRCVDYLCSLPAVDKGRIGCAGLSLGGEMAMWLGAMDSRIAATCSSGFLTVMDQMEKNHCLCWKFEGLRELADFADIYSLIAPRSLQCQNGLQEDKTMFTVPLAQKALEEIKPIYADFNASNRLALDVHAGAHEIDLPPLLDFFEKNLITSGE